MRSPSITFCLTALMLVSACGWAVGERPTGVSEIFIDPERLCPVVDGEPFFAIGACGIPPHNMKEAAEAGFNLTIRWGGYSNFSNRLKKALAEGDEAAREYVCAYLDAAEQAGLWVMENPCLFAYDQLQYGNLASFGNFGKFLEEPLPQLVDMVKDHPALFGYYGPDEPRPDEYELCRDYTEVVRSRDPRHPVYILFWLGIQESPDAYYIVGLDWYPRSTGETPLIGAYYAATRSSQRAHRNHKPYWHVPLMDGSYDTAHLSGAAQRAQTYLVLIGGANGIIWWV